MLFAIARNTGFETDKGTLGVCFTVDCCDWSERQELRVALDLTIRPFYIFRHLIQRALQDGAEPVEGVGGYGHWRR